MKKRKEPVFTIGSFFGSKFEMFFRCKKTYRADLQSVMKPLPLLSPFALFPSLLKIHHSPIHYSQLRIITTLSLGSFYFLLHSSKFTIHQFTIHNCSSPHPFPWLFLLFTWLLQIHYSPFTIHHSPFTYSQLTFHQKISFVRPKFHGNIRCFL